MQKRIMMNARSDGVQGPAVAQSGGGMQPVTAAPGVGETGQAAPPPPPPPPPPAAPIAPVGPPPPQRQAMPLASILTASTRQAHAQAAQAPPPAPPMQRPGMVASPVTPQPPPPPERAQSHRPQFRNDQAHRWHHRRR